MPRSRKAVDPLAPVPPGPDMLELRYGRRGEMTRIVFAQAVHSYSIDTTDPSKVVITGVVRLPDTPKPVAEQSEPESAPSEDVSEA